MGLFLLIVAIRGGGGVIPSNYPLIIESRFYKIESHSSLQESEAIYNKALNGLPRLDCVKSRNDDKNTESRFYNAKLYSHYESCASKAWRHCETLYNQRGRHCETLRMQSRGNTQITFYGIYLDIESRFYKIESHSSLRGSEATEAIHNKALNGLPRLDFVKSRNDDKNTESRFYKVARHDFVLRSKSEVSNNATFFTESKFFTESRFYKITYFNRCFAIAQHDESVLSFDYDWVFTESRFYKVVRYSSLRGSEATEAIHNKALNGLPRLDFVKSRNDDNAPLFTESRFYKVARHTELERSESEVSNNATFFTESKFFTESSFYRCFATAQHDDYSPPFDNAIFDYDNSSFCDDATFICNDCTSCNDARSVV